MYHIQRPQTAFIKLPSKLYHDERTPVRPSIVNRVCKRRTCVRPSAEGVKLLKKYLTYTSKANNQFGLVYSSNHIIIVIFCVNVIDGYFNVNI